MASFSRDTAIAGPQAKRPCIRDTPMPNSAPKLSSAGLSSFNFTPQDTSDKSYLKNRADIVKPFKETDAVKKSAYNPATIARDVLIAAGRHPTERPLNHHLLCLRDTFAAVDLTSDLASFRWDLVDPGQPTAPADLDRVAKSRDDNELRTPDPRSAPVPAVPAQAPPTPLPAVNTHHHHNNNNNIQHPSPPTQQAHIPNRDIQPPSRRQTPLETPKSTPRPPSQPPVHSNSPAVQPKMVVGKRPPGRPPKSSKPPMVEKPAAPVPYPVYRCFWRNCCAELHNLDMLKRHIGRTHIPHTLVCEWADCTVTKNMPAVELLRHVKKEHIEPIAWKLGDGPSVPRTIDDTAGSPVPKTIPELSHPEGEDSLIFPASDSSIRAFNKVHGKHSQREKAMEIMKAVQRMKGHVGFGLDPGGCQLATPARNERVSNEENFYEVV
ncbi:C2H2 finger domain protein [Aspergillus terreus]|uniref:C2H2 finger domain protein n=1 Tax=Aspergillus terreus TaxID=33178 RepID=A0A5M3Z1G8_ASPTE|nr:hypothetical protein ATETN484_0007010900 [Aspergillus terreus]GFF15914.1 C2H2 finger domain protein [Aspergillus terreus]